MPDRQVSIPPVRRHWKVRACPTCAELSPNDMTFVQGCSHRDATEDVEVVPVAEIEAADKGRTSP